MSKLFIPYIMGNKQFLENVKLLDKNGADIIGVGIPFSDPVADGPIIMRASHETLQNHTTIDYIFDELDKHQNEVNCKCVLMTYYSVILDYGEKAFFKKCDDIGVCGVIIPDSPFGLIEQLKQQLNDNRIVKIISLIAMTADTNRVQNIAKHAEGFIYTVTMNATTGEDGTFHPELEDQIKMIKSFAALPVAAGFGIRTTDHIKDLVKDVDGVVIGGEIVRRFESDDLNQTGEYLREIRQTLSSY